MVPLEGIKEGMHVVQIMRVNGGSGRKIKATLSCYEYFF